MKGSAILLALIGLYVAVGVAQPAPTPTECPGDLVASDCVCIRSCLDPNPTCIEGVCFPGCQCPEGMFVDEVSRCVDECPTKTCPIEDQVVVPCASVCQPTCAQPVIDFCTEQCEIDGCRCPDGTYLDEPARACVECLDDCSANQECPMEGQQFTTCGTSCPPTCMEPEVDFCTDDCKVGCQCPAGSYLDELRRVCVDSLSNCSETTPETPTECPSDQPQASCLLDPCSFATCPNMPCAKCIPNYCGGCKPEFFNDEGDDVTARCNDNGTSPCGGDVPQVFCFISPCQVCSCPAFPEAECEDDYCGGCNARWYTEDGEVTDQCLNVTIECRYEGSTYSDCGSACPPTCANPDPGPCITLCVPGCVCPVGEYLDEAAGRCVSNLEDCSDDPVCPIDGQKYTDCGTACPPTCDDPYPLVCTLQCVPGCQCPEGTLFDQLSSKCVTDLDDCASEVFVSCPPLDPDTLGLCVEQCPDDGCPTGQKCCSNGCGRTCTTTLEIPYYDPPLDCPDERSESAVCIIACNNDTNCGSTMVCCETGCGGSICTAGIPTNFICSVIRDRLLNTTSICAYIPQCADDGSFQPVQCHGSTGYCWCVDVETGKPVTELSPRGQKPTCNSCVYAGQAYQVGDQFPAGDDCNYCFCGADGTIGCTEKACIDVCSLDKDPGDCDGFFPRYYYNESGKCEIFVYGGCGGNGNNFDSLSECLRTCDQDSICLLPSMSDSCETSTDTPRYYFDPVSARCEKVEVACTNGDVNNFETEVECAESCVGEVCEYDGKVRYKGDIFDHADGCNHCACVIDGDVLCTNLSCVTCEYGGEEYKPGQSYPDEDGCNSCTCSPNGESLCTEVACPQVCPDDLPLVFCFADPCEVPNAVCPNYPNARCEADYCGGCNRKWYTTDDGEVTDDCFPDTTSPCPDDEPIVDCFVDPCLFSSCPGSPNATCVSCGECTARFYVVEDQQRVEVTDECRGSCPSGIADVFCFVDPCTFTRCPRVPDAKCISCGDCTARFFNEENTEVTDQCETPECPADLSEVSCLGNPCDYTLCPRVPNARCVPDYCGGCNVKFYDGDEEITDECEILTTPTSISVNVCPYLELDMIAAAFSSCSINSDCPNNDLCCTFGSSTICAPPTSIPYYDITLLECPATPGLLGVCSSTCQFDSDCPQDRQICCPSGCTKTCVTGAASSRPCKALRETLDDDLLVGAYVPQCDDDGNFEDVQCWGSTGYCWCVDPKTGKPLGGAVRGQVPQCTTCEYLGQTYYPGDSFDANDDCNKCECTESGQVDCGMETCGGEDPCEQPADPGLCLAYIPRYYYDREDEQCKRFIYGGCGGNDNRFDSITACLRRCNSDSGCLLKKDPGPCDEVERVFYFDVDTGVCEAFEYGGCEGNENRFCSREECLKACDPDSPAVPCADADCGPQDCTEDEYVYDPLVDVCCPYCLPQEECEEDEKQCSDGTCITVDYLCDGIVDCSTGEDEEGCSATCAFRCSDGVCLPQEYVCDGWLDCREAEDETSCSIPPTDLPYWEPPQTCPSVLSTCQESCRRDTDCDDGQLCCSNDCCMRGVPVAPICPAVREVAMNLSGLIGSYIPQCEEDGSFTRVQCHASTGYCWCVDTQNGVATSGAVRDPEPECGGCNGANDTTYDIGDVFDVDCNTCVCTATGIICSSSPCSCRYDGNSYDNGDRYGDDCNECLCTYGQWKCQKKPCVLPPAALGSFYRMRLTYQAEYDAIADRIDEFLREVRGTILLKYRDSLGLSDAQLMDIRAVRGSVVIIVDIMEMENSTDGANVTLVVSQVQQDYEAGGLVIRYNGEVLEPSGEFSSSVVSGSEGDDDDDDEGLSGGAIIGIVVAVVVGVVLVTLIVAVTVVILMKMRSGGGKDATSASSNDYEGRASYTKHHEAVEMKVAEDA